VFNLAVKLDPTVFAGFVDRKGRGREVLFTEYAKWYD
jgi:hypothetical protein